jgi:hypothetical protein
MELIFEWDEKKAAGNARKHKVGFDEARTVFGDPLLIAFPDETHSNDDTRFISIGVSIADRILLVVRNEEKDDRGDLPIRIVSCRKATASERII